MVQTPRRKFKQVAPPPKLTDVLDRGPVHCPAREWLSPTWACVPRWGSTDNGVIWALGCPTWGKNSRG